MKTLKNNIIILTLILALTTACSQQTRTNHWQPTVDEMAQSVQIFLDNAQTRGLTAGDSNIISTVEELVKSDEQNHVIYWANSGETGEASSVASVLDFSLFSLPSSSFLDLVSSTVMLLDEGSGVDRNFKFIMTIKLVDPNGTQSENMTVAFQTQNFTFTEHRAVIDFGQFRLITNNVSEAVAEDFEGVVQFQIEDVEGVSNGQFSSMIGFGEKL